MPKVYLYSLETKATHEVTDGWYNSSDPGFSADGRYLFFVSDRDFNPVFSRVEYNYAYQAMSRIYLVTLAADIKSPFEPKSDEVEVRTAPEEPRPGAGAPDKKKASAETEAKPAEPAKPVTVKVDAEGLKSRVVGLPVAPANYGSLKSVGDKIYYQSMGGDRRLALKMYDLAEKKETDLGPVNGYEISADGKKMLVGSDGSYAIIELPKAPIKIEEKLDLSQMEMTVDLKAEWTEIYEECWRQMKHFFYVPNMGGVDWDAMRLRYRPLADAVHHRADLTYVIGELIGELSTGHTYVGGGDVPVPPKIKLGLLGARLEREPKTGFYSIAQILSRAELEPLAPLAAHRDRRQRQGGRLHPGRRRCRHERHGGYLRFAYTTRRVNR